MLYVILSLTSSPAQHVFLLLLLGRSPPLSMSPVHPLPSCQHGTLIPTYRPYPRGRPIKFYWYGVRAFSSSSLCYFFLPFCSLLSSPFSSIFYFRFSLPPPHLPSLSPFSDKQLLPRLLFIRSRLPTASFLLAHSSHYSHSSSSIPYPLTPLPSLPPLHRPSLPTSQRPSISS